MSFPTSLIGNPVSLFFHAGFRPRTTRSFCCGKRTQNHWRPGVASGGVPVPQSRLLGLRNSLRSDSPRLQNRICGTGAQPRPKAPGLCMFCHSRHFSLVVIPAFAGMTEGKGWRRQKKTRWEHMSAIHITFFRRRHGAWFDESGTGNFPGRVGDSNSAWGPVPGFAGGP